MNWAAGCGVVACARRAEAGGKVLPSSNSILSINGVMNESTA
jgi:hypothetical protein